MWLQRGLCGLDFKKQTTAIGVLYSFICAVALIYGFVLVGNPEAVAGPSFFPGHDPSTVSGEVKLDSINSTEALSTTTVALPNDTTIMSSIVNSTDSATPATNEFEKEKQEEVSVAGDEETAKKIEDEEIVSEEREHYNNVISHIQTKGTEMVVGSVVTLGLCIMLILGAKHDKSIMIVPWLTEQTIGLITVAVVGFAKLIGGRSQVSAGMIVLLLLLYVCGALFTWMVMSHFVMLRKMKQHSKNIINSVMQSSGYQTGANYDRLRDELGQARELQEIGPTDGPHTRPESKQKDDLLYFSV